MVNDHEKSISFAKEPLKKRKFRKKIGGKDTNLKKNCRKKIFRQRGKKNVNFDKEPHW